MKVSAIISAYFCEEWLEGRIENLKDQTLRPQIVTVCEFESPEYKIADRLWEGEDVVIQTPYGSEAPTIYAAWNMGIEAAQGEYVTNANADDRLARWGIEKLAHQLDVRPEISVVYADVDKCTDLSGGFDHAWRSGYFKWWEGENQYETLLSGLCFLGPMPMWRKSLHDKHGYFDDKMKSAGDYEFWLRLAKGGEKFYHLREAQGIYLDRGDSAEHRDLGVGARESDEARRRYNVDAPAGPYG